MRHDPDILSIQRRRRQERRCVACGVESKRTTLCRAGAATLRYCPRCEAIYPYEQTSQRSTAQGRTTAYCLPCGNAVRRGDGLDWTAYAAAQHAKRHAHLPAIIRMYRQGIVYREIADQLGVNRGTLRAIVQQARRRGHWPKALKRRAS